MAASQLPTPSGEQKWTFPVHLRVLSRMSSKSPDPDPEASPQHHFPTTTTTTTPAPRREAEQDITEVGPAPPASSFTRASSAARVCKPTHGNPTCARSESHEAAHNSAMAPPTMTAREAKATPIIFHTQPHACFFPNHTAAGCTTSSTTRVLSQWEGLIAAMCQFLCRSSRVPNLDSIVRLRGVSGKTAILKADTGQPRS